MGAIDTEKILKELDRLWASTGKSSEEEGAAVLRACSLNLLVVTSGEVGELSNSLSDLTRQHPSRTIILRLSPGAEATLDARANVICWMPFGKRQQICSEQIVVESSVGGVAGIPPLVSGLLASDLPVILWYEDAERAGSMRLEKLDRLANKIIVDGRDCADPEDAVRILELCRDRAGQAADLGWTAITPWRELIAHAYSSEEALAQLESVRAVELDYCEETGAWSGVLLLAWLAASLGWKAVEGTFEHAGRNLSVVMRAGREGDTLRLAGDGWETTIAKSRGGETRLSRDGVRSCTVLPGRTKVELAAQEVGLPGRDDVFEKTFAVARQIAPRF